MHTYNWVLKTAFPNAIQHLAAKDGDHATASTSVCGVEASRRRLSGRPAWYSVSRWAFPRRRMCPACTRAATA